MIRAEAYGRSNRGGRPAAGFLGGLAVLAIVVAVGPSGRALAFQSPGASRSVLGPGSADGPAMDVSGEKKPAEPASAGEKAKLTPQEARELIQAIRQIQAAVHADRQAAPATVDVKVHRPARTVTPPTLTSEELDRLVDSHLTRNDPKVEPAPITTDVEFVRRVYFDLIGKPPTPEQFMAFVRDRSHEKRGRLIDSLLGSPDWARSFARYWRDVIRFHATNENLFRIRFDELEDWLADQLRRTSRGTRSHRR